MEIITRALVRREERLASHIHKLKKAIPVDTAEDHAIRIELEKLDQAEVEFRTFMRAFLQSAREYVHEEDEEDAPVNPDDEIDIEKLEEEESDSDDPVGDPTWDGYHSSEAEDMEEVKMDSTYVEGEDSEEEW